MFISSNKFILAYVFYRDRQDQQVRLYRKDTNHSERQKFIWEMKKTIRSNGHVKLQKLKEF